MTFPDAPHLSASCPDALYEVRTLPLNGLATALAKMKASSLTSFTKIANRGDFVA